MVNRKNYKLVREFLRFKKEINQLSQGSIHRYRSALHHFLIWLDETLLESCTKKYPAFPAYLQKNRLDGGSENLSHVTQKKTLQIVKQFLNWVKITYPQRFHKISLVWIESMQTAPAIQVPKIHGFVSLEDAKKLATSSLPEDRLVYRRDQAAAAMLFLSGMRASSFVSLPIKAIDLTHQEIKQWPSLGVRTKFRKHATTYLLDIPPLFEVVRNWDNFIRSELPEDAMWYPVIISEWSSEKLSSKAPGNNRHIHLAKRIRKLSNLVGIEYKSPHKFRHGHAVFALLQAQNMADYKAISQNLMHGSIKVTDSIYAWLNDNQVKDRITSLSTNQAQPKNDTELAIYLSQLSKLELKQAIQVAADHLAN